MKKSAKEVKKNEFRRSKVSQHPTYIYARVGDEFKYIGLTHSSITGDTKNIKLDKNPNPADKRPAYFRPNAERDRVNKFKKPEKGWRFSKKDREKVKKYEK